MPGIVGIDHLVLSVGDFTRSKAFYNKLLTFLGFKLKHEYDDMAGWSNGRTLFWISAADPQGRKRKYRKGDIGFHHYAFELSSRADMRFPLSMCFYKLISRTADAIGSTTGNRGAGVSEPLGSDVMAGAGRQVRWAINQQSLRL